MDAIVCQARQKSKFKTFASDQGGGQTHHVVIFSTVQIQAWNPLEHCIGEGGSRVATEMHASVSAFHQLLFESGFFSI